ncbi:NfeD family protein [Cellulosilyticum ruminicola]|uniref:NfeD family protein n=1 Tax=Cellulosilyticum ruminicola TaxID=425254 RepID=UPI0006D0BCE4|nr:NfeD family protein [Cellulosilyticum ruminicola]
MALITSFFTSNLIIQTVIFLIVSLILLITLTKRITKKLSQQSTIATNIDGLIGKKGIVIEAIGKNSLEPGLVKLDGEVWTATSLHDEVIEKGSLVEIKKINGVRLIVSSIQN